MSANEIVTRSDERLTDANGELIGWVSKNGKFHPCGTALTVDQLRAIIEMLVK